MKFLTLSTPLNKVVVNAKYFVSATLCGDRIHVCQKYSTEIVIQFESVEKAADAYRHFIYQIEQASYK